ncbi:FtsX-like permease family protein [Streptomyces sp. XM4193]|uniref:ABC transporter permease n=1 Tax=Streptomyces sp. XM4193 TaxID=2929782 RepID=UPI001FF7D717|nr:FtsX-like permease family protein [Streptomyces sp. XM4193]MCK1794739.1 FtsX-like permease family protein [Streptomyces sp. XM4193]
MNPSAAEDAANAPPHRPPRRAPHRPRARSTALVLVAWQGVRRRPLRHTLTALSLLVGVLGVVLVQGAGDQLEDALVRDSVLGNGRSTTLLVPVTGSGREVGLRENVADWRAVLSRLSADGDGVVAAFVQDGTVRIHAAHDPRGDAPAEVPGDARAAAAGSTVGAVTGTGPASRTALPAVVDGEELLPGITLLAVDPELRLIRPFPVLHGSWFQTPTLGPQLVLNRAAWRRLPAYGPPLALSRTGAHDRYRARLVGVVDDGSDEPQGYVGLAGGGPWNSGVHHRRSAVALLLHSPSLDADTLRARIETHAQITGRLGELGDIRRLDNIDDHTAQLDAGRRAFLAAAALVLLVGCLGILNVGLATARERSQELSLRRSFGATRGHLVRIVVLESQLVALLAAAAAIGIASLVTDPLLHQLGGRARLEPSGPPLGAMVAGVLTSCGTALVGALAPALRAARVPIARAAR